LSSLGVFRRSPGKRVRLSLNSKRNTLAHGGPVEVFVKFKPYNLSVIVILDVVHNISVKVDE
jgi:hypothetical protein